MDPNTLFLLIIGGASGYAALRRFWPGRATAAPDVDQRGALVAQRGAVEQSSAPDMLSLATVLAHLNDKRDDVPHFFSIGGTGAGKSTFARIVLAPRVARGENFIILTGKRSSVFEDLPCIGRDPIGADGAITFEAARAAFMALQREIGHRDNTPIRQRAFTTLNILIDDATILLAALPEAAKFLRDCALLGRELDMRLIVQLGSLRVKELGWEGRGDLREHFAVVTLEKDMQGRRSARLRPRFDDDSETFFDFSQGNQIASRLRIDAGRAWREPRDRDVELREQLGIEPVRGGDFASSRTSTNQYAVPVRAVRPDTDAVRDDDALILALVERGVSANRIYEIVGGTRADVLARVRELKGE